MKGNVMPTIDALSDSDPAPAGQPGDQLAQLSAEIVKAEVADAGLDELAHIVRDEIHKARIAWSNALGHAMKAGDALIAVQLKVAERGITWKKWIKKNCFIGVSTAQLYMQLARHRDQIEAELQSRGELNLRGARQLISAAHDDADDDEGESGDGDGENEDKATANPPDPESLIEHWHRSPTELTALLDAIGVEGMLKAMSGEFGRQLREKLPTKRKPFYKPKKKTLNLTANSARNGRGTHSRH
jgi:hypothetical protein